MAVLMTDGVAPTADREFGALGVEGFDFQEKHSGSRTPGVGWVEAGQAPFSLIRYCIGLGTDRSSGGAVDGFLEALGADGVGEGRTTSRCECGSATRMMADSRRLWTAGFRPWTG